jgi:transcriptional regulator NrdR family protein
MNCPKCRKDRAHRAERKSPLDHTLNWFFLKPYFCRDCSYRFHTFPDGSGGPTLRMEFDQRMQNFKRKKGRKRLMRDLTFYGAAGLVIVALLYLMSRQSANP